MSPKATTFHAPELVSRLMRPGDVGFDPVGFSDFIPIDFLREAELKHGRICQLAVVGFITTDLGIHLPGAMHEVRPVAVRMDAALGQGG